MRDWNTEKDLVKTFSDCGFTVNQAKVYFRIIQSESTCVSEISESTQLYRQDIYKILLKLEKMGLITKTIDEPFVIEAIPVEKCLMSMISAERKKANERISRLETNLKELTNQLGKQQKLRKRKTLEEERKFILLKTDSEIAHMRDLAFKNLRIEFDWVTNYDLMTRLTQSFSENFKLIARKEAKIRIIVENLKKDDLVKKTLEKIRPDRGDFAAKLMHKSKCLPYQIFDHKELWISRKKVTGHGFPNVFWTNSRNITEFYEDSFKKAWNSRCAINIC